MVFKAMKLVVINLGINIDGKYKKPEAMGCLGEVLKRELRRSNLINWTNLYLMAVPWS